MDEKRWPPPGYPLVEGEYALTAEWKLTVTQPFARRIEDGSLVLWRPGLTLWLAVWGNDHGVSQSERVARARTDASPSRFDEREMTVGGVTHFGYRLRDENEDGAIESINALVFSDDGHLLLSAYFDEVTAVTEAWQIVESVAYEDRNA